MSKTININLYEPTPPQLKALDVLYIDKPFITLLNYGRQTGKSYMALMEAIYMCLGQYEWTRTTVQYRVMFVCPTNILVDKHIDTIQAMFSDMPEARDLVFKGGQNGIKTKDKELHFANGSILLFRSAEQGDSLRGETINFMFIDEAAFQPRKFVTEVLMPMLARTGGRMFVFSTPNGRNWFYEWYNEGQKPENRKDKISLRADYRELNDPEVDKVIMAMKKSMTSMEFAREVMGEFVTDGSLFNNVEGRIFPKDHIIDLHCDRYIGIDVGVTNDFTVLTCVNKKLEVIDIDRFNIKEDNLDYKGYVERIKAFIKKHQKYLYAAYFEVNNKDLLFEDLTSDPEMYKLEEFNTNVSSKPKIINNLIKQFEDEKILIPDNDTLIAELYAYSSKTNPITGRVQFQNVGEAHDDMVSSLAIACWCWFEGNDGGTIEFYEK
jgi:phage FluMu gp28-like protein